MIMNHSVNVVECTGKTQSDCWKCNRFYSSHSLHREEGRTDETITVSCSIGGDRRFDENGAELPY